MGLDSVPEMGGLQNFFFRALRINIFFSNKDLNKRTIKNNKLKC